MLLDFREYVILDDRIKNEQKLHYAKISALEQQINNIKIQLEIEKQKQKTIICENKLLKKNLVTQSRLFNARV